MPTYGGNQMLSPRKSVRRCGCGPVAASDLIIYLTHNRPECAMKPAPRIPASVSVGKDDYFRFLDSLRRLYVPTLYPFGVNGLVLAAGVALYFLVHRMPLRAFWCCSRRKIMPRIQDMLTRDIPVVLAIGPNFPIFFSSRHKLQLYIRTSDGYVPRTGINAHYVTVTGIEGEWLRISSWGNEYYINRGEYDNYIRKYSNPLFSNILYVKDRKKRHSQKQ